MLPSKGYFKSFNCPFYDSDVCERPHCHYRHNKKEKVDSPASPPDQSSVTKIKLLETSYGRGNSLEFNEAFEKFLDETYYKSDDESSRVENNVLNTTRKPPCVGNPSPAESSSSYTLPSEVPKYNPTPISVLKKRHIPVAFAPDMDKRVLPKKTVKKSRVEYIPRAENGMEPSASYSPTPSSLITKTRNEQYSPYANSNWNHTYIPSRITGNELEMPYNCSPSKSESIAGYSTNNSLSMSKTFYNDVVNSNRTIIPDQERLEYSLSDDSECDDPIRVISALNNLDLDDIGPELDMLEQIVDETLSLSSENETLSKSSHDHVAKNMNSALEMLQMDLSDNKDIIKKSNNLKEGGGLKQSAEHIAIGGTGKEGKDKLNDKKHGSSKSKEHKSHHSRHSSKHSSKSSSSKTSEKRKSETSSKSKPSNNSSSKGNKDKSHSTSKEKSKNSSSLNKSNDESEIKKRHSSKSKHNDKEKSSSHNSSNKEKQVKSNHSSDKSSKPKSELSHKRKHSSSHSRESGKDGKTHSSKSDSTGSHSHENRKDGKTRSSKSDSKRKSKDSHHSSSKRRKLQTADTENGKESSNSDVEEVPLNPKLSDAIVITDSDSDDDKYSESTHLVTNTSDYKANIEGLSSSSVSRVDSNISRNTKDDDSDLGFIPPTSFKKKTRVSLVPSCSVERKVGQLKPKPINSPALKLVERWYSLTGQSTPIIAGTDNANTASTSGAGGPKIRIAHVPYANKIIKAKENLLKSINHSKSRTSEAGPSGPPVVKASTSKVVGQQPNLILAAVENNKVPSVKRKQHLERLYSILLQKYIPEVASVKANKVERDICVSSSTFRIYANKVVQWILSFKRDIKRITGKVAKPNNENMDSENMDDEKGRLPIPSKPIYFI